MTAAEFRTWLERRELSDADAAPLLRAKRHEVWRWRTGERKVPGKVERIVELMDAEPRLTEPCGCYWYLERHEDEDVDGTVYVSYSPARVPCAKHHREAWAKMVLPGP